MTDWIWDAWLETLDDERQARASALRDRFAALGADDPEGWARSEMNTGIAQLPRFVFLRGVWSRVLAEWRDPEWIDWELEDGDDSSRSALRRARELGLTDEELVAIAGCVSQQVAFGLLNYLDGGLNHDMNDEDDPPPGWCLLEVVIDPATEESRVTTRVVGGLHEGFYEINRRT